MLAISNGLLLIWGFFIDPLLTDRFTQQAKSVRHMRAYNRGVLAAAATVRTIAARPELLDFDYEPAELLLAVARGIEQGIREPDA
jgi:hypothetical protein